MDLFNAYRPAQHLRQEYSKQKSSDVRPYGDASFWRWFLTRQSRQETEAETNSQE